MGHAKRQRDLASPGEECARHDGEVAMCSILLLLLSIFCKGATFDNLFQFDNPCTDANGKFDNHTIIDLVTRGK